jgi:16S rRNA (guanine527-N7)-methyltransferase
MPRLRRYAELVIHWNRSVSNLLSRNDEERFVERHLLESLGPLRALLASGHARWIDIGSGGGLPAIPLAIAGVGSSWMLVESRRMKTLFLQKVRQELELKAVEVICARIEAISLPAELPTGLTSRATLHLGPTFHEALRFLASGSHAFLWKGERRNEELREATGWESDWSMEQTILLPDTPTVVISFKKI